MINASLCDGFFDCPPVLTKSVAEMTFSLAYLLNVAFVAQYHINEIKRKAGLVIVDTEKRLSLRRSCVR